LCISRGRMLLLCKPVRDNERKCSPVARKNQDKKHFRVQGGGAGPRGCPLAGPLTVLLLLLPLGPCVVNLLTGFSRKQMDTVKLQLASQYRENDQSPGRDQRLVKPFPSARGVHLAILLETAEGLRPQLC
jgi:hypothetical protein